MCKGEQGLGLACAVCRHSCSAAAETCKSLETDTCGSLTFLLVATSITKAKPCNRTYLCFPYYDSDKANTIEDMRAFYDKFIP